LEEIPFILCKIKLEDMTIPETHFQPSSTIDMERFVALRMFPASVRGIFARTGLEWSEMSCDTVRKETAPSFVRLFRYFHNISKINPLFLTIFIGRGGGG
jgi:hypothetical protein